MTDQKRDTVLISYSHKDNEWLERLRVHLRLLESRAAGVSAAATATGAVESSSTANQVETRWNRVRMV